MVAYYHPCGFIGNSRRTKHKPDFVKHTRGYLLHNTKPESMTEEQAIEYLIMKDIPERVWKDYEQANRKRLLIVKKEQLPSSNMA